MSFSTYNRKYYENALQRFEREFESGTECHGRNTDFPSLDERLMILWRENPKRYFCIAVEHGKWYTVTTND